MRKHKAVGRLLIQDHLHWLKILNYFNGKEQALQQDLWSSLPAEIKLIIFGQLSTPIGAGRSVPSHGHWVMQKTRLTKS